MPWDKAKKTEGEVLKEYAISSGVPLEDILVTKNVVNTAEEAVAVRELIGSSKRIILVTSSYHMYRSQLLFEKQGFEVIPYKTDFKTNFNSVITILDFLPNSNNLELSENSIKEIIGIIYYNLLQ